MKKRFIFTFLVFGLISFAEAQNEQTRISHYNINKHEIALSSYDAVSYFDGSPKKGKKKFKYQYKGIYYLFSSESNKNKFASNPDAFEPAYGGWCAYAMGDYGEKVEVNPKTYKIIEGKLYLFYNAYFNNTLTSWNKDETRLKKKADENWSKIII